MKGRIDPKDAAAALRLDCPQCRATPGVRCFTYRNKIRGHCRLHVERLDAARRLLRAENRSQLQKEFGRIGDAV